MMPNFMKHRIIDSIALILRCSVFLLAAESAFAQNSLTGSEAESGLQILYHEPLRLVESGQRRQASRDYRNTEGDQTSDVLIVHIDAFGQSYDLELESNERLIADLPEAQREQIAKAAKLYRGRILGFPDSWVRLTRHRDGWSGMFWDGADAHIVDRAHKVSKALDLDPQQRRAAQSAPYSIIYRLSDIQHGNHCGLEANARTIQSYGAMTDKLSSLFVSALPVATEELPVSVVGDVQFVQANSDPTATLAARMNVVDGIYSDQVGVVINVVEIQALSNNGPLTSFNATRLLNQFAGFAQGTNPGLAHLFTGRNISSGVAGIAYLGVLCNSNFGVGVSEDLGSFGALIAAHEIGHNFGSPHDNQGGSPCASTPGIFLMNPSINGSDQLSQCSLSQMQPHVAAASCITPIAGGPDPIAEVRPSLPVNPINATVNVPFDYEIEIRNSGDDTAIDVNATVRLPAALALDGPAPNGCAADGADSGGVTVTCNLGELAGDTNRQIRLTLLGSEAGQFLGDVSVDAANDANPNNNEVQATIVVSGGGEPCADCIDFGTTATTPYSNQDNVNSGSVAVRDGGATLALTGNRWRQTVTTFAVTPDTVLELDFSSTSEGEIHGIGFDEDNSINSPRIFQLFGTQLWNGALEHGTRYTDSGLGSYQHFRIPVGEYYTGSAMRLVLVNDKDGGFQNNSGAFRNVRIFEDSPGGGDGGCPVDLDFEVDSDLAGWIVSPASTCATGAFVLGTPTQQRSIVVTQVGGDHTTGSGNAIFTASNSSVGSADVDHGTCVLESPTWSIADGSKLSVWYFHGQRDTGDDPGGDGFSLEISTDGGSSFNPLVAIGDIRTTAVWTEAQRTIGAGSSVKLRLQVSDGPRTGDIVEGGIDDLSICTQ